MVPAKKPDYCPNKEYWFGPGEEAQAKPAGFRFKRGTLLKIRSAYMTSQYSSAEAGVRLITPRVIDKDSGVLLLLGYDSNNTKHRVVDLTSLKSQYVEAVEHKFTFLFGEKMETFTLTTWGSFYKTRHNEMWVKARKVRTHPTKKRKKRAKGFSFDEI